MGPRVKAFRGFLGAVAVTALAAAGSIILSAERSSAEEPPSQEFLRAMRLFRDPALDRRNEGERQIQSMGRRALPQLRAWISRSQGETDRARELLARLGGERTEAEEALAAARPFLSNAVASAWSRFHAGDYREAKRTAEAVVRLDPDSPELWQLRRLIRQCEERLISKEILEPMVEFRELVYGLDESPRLLFRLVNRSHVPIQLRADRGILGALQIVFERRFIDGSEKTDQRTVTIRTLEGEEKVSLPPGASHEQETVVYIEEPKPPEGMVLRVKASGKFQPSQWEMEEKKVVPTISVPAAECWVVPASEKTLAIAPLKKLETAIYFHEIRAFFTAGQLSIWAAEDDPLLNEKLLKTLVESLPELDEVGIKVAESLLQKASGRKREARAASAEEVSRDWGLWWQERKRGESEAREEPSPLPKILER